MKSAFATPYLTVNDGAAALAFYSSAFGAIETMRVVMDVETGQLGHSEFYIGQARFHLSDEFPEMGVQSPSTLGGTSVAIHLQVDDVDEAFSVAVAAGATSQRDPADQPHGARQGTLIDPFGHRWMLSQEVREVSPEKYQQMASDYGMQVIMSGAKPPGAMA